MAGGNLSMQFSIPFNRSDLQGDEINYLQEAVKSGQIAGDQVFTRRVQRLIEEELQGPSCLLTTSCTHALEMSALLLDIGPGDEVIMPSFTFVSTANAFALRGAKIVFADIRSDTLNLDESLLPSLVTPRTKAVVPVHYAGIGCEMDAINRTAHDGGFQIIEDNAHGLFGKYKGQWLGTFGSLATQSFHETKNFSCGEGGALLINDPSLVERAEIIREKGTNRAKFFRGEIDKYTWVDLGSSYVPSDLLAAYLLAQIEVRDRIQSTRKRLWQRYQGELASWCDQWGVSQPTVPPDTEPAWHLYYLLMPDLSQREALRLKLREEGILAVTHYVPLHSSPHASGWGIAPDACPVTNQVTDTLLRLPFYNGMSESEQSRVIETILSFTPPAKTA